MARNYAALKHEYLDEMDILTDEEFGRLCRALLIYSRDGTPVELPGMERAYAKRVMKQEDQFQESYEQVAATRRENGRKGGRPKKEENRMVSEKPNGFPENRMVFEETEKSKSKSKSKSNSNSNSNDITPHTPLEGGEPEQFSAGFRQFWTNYPRKVGKQAAWKTWSRRKLEPLTKVILNAVEYQKSWDSWAEDGGRYVPNPATWLNQGRWEDEPTEILRPDGGEKHGTANSAPEGAEVSGSRWGDLPFD